MTLPHVPDDALEAYLMGRLPTGLEATIEEHLLGCEYCIDRIEELEAQLHAISRACVRSRRISEKVVTIVADPQKPTATRTLRFQVIAGNVAAIAAAIWLMIMIPSWFPTLNHRPAVRPVAQLSQIQPTVVPIVESRPPPPKILPSAVLSSPRPRLACVVHRARGKRMTQPMTLPRMGPIRPFELPEKQIAPTPELALLDAPPTLAMDHAELDLSQLDQTIPTRPHGNILRTFATPFRHFIRLLTKNSDSAESERLD